MELPNLVPVSCPTCRTEFDVGHLPKGTRTFCPKCRTIVSVPQGAPGAAAAEASAPPAPIRPSPAPPPAPAPAQAPELRPQTSKIAQESAAGEVRPPQVTPARPEPVASPPAPPRVLAPEAGPSASSAPRRGLAVACLVLGVASFVIPGLGILALVLGAIALASGPKEGKAMALTGAASGLVSAVLYLILLVGWVLPAIDEAICRARMSALHVAIDTYRQRTGSDPSSVGDLVASGILPSTEADCPSNKKKDGKAYVLLTEQGMQASGLRVVERDNYHGSQGRMVLTSGGEIQFRLASSLPPLAELPPPDEARGPADSETKSVTLEWAATSWRSGGAYDFQSALRRSFEEAGVKVVPPGARADGALVVSYEERRGPHFTSGVFGSVLEMTLTLSAPGSAEKLLVLSGYGASKALPKGESPQTEGALFGEALEAFQVCPGVVHAGALVGAALGLKRSDAKLVEALLSRQTREVALDLLEKDSYHPTTPRAEAA